MNDLKEILEHRSQELVEMLCGPRYHPTGTHVRAGTNTRPFATRLGEVKIRFHLVKQPSGKIFAPLWSDVVAQPRKHFQDDIVELAVNGTQRMTYRNTAEEIERATGVRMSAATLNRRVQEHGKRLQEHLATRSITTQAIVPDGTKLRSQKGGHHELRISITENQEGTAQLRFLSVGRHWIQHRIAVRRHTVFRDSRGRAGPPCVTTDGEHGLTDNFRCSNSNHQACLIHLERALSHALWRDGLWKRDKHRQLVENRVRGILRHLRNSVALHAPRGEKRAIRKRIRETRKELLEIVGELNEQELYQAASSLQAFTESATVFATLALEGYWLPWHTNRVERVMLEVAKRCKHRGMRWTDHGSMALLALLVYRFLEPQAYEHWWNTHLYGSASLKPDHGIHITVTAWREF